MMQETTTTSTGIRDRCRDDGIVDATMVAWILTTAVLGSATVGIHHCHGRDADGLLDPNTCLEDMIRGSHAHEDGSDNSGASQVPHELVGDVG